MGQNTNNYLGTDLSWTPYTSRDDLPVGEQLAFRNGDEVLFGKVSNISNGVMLIVNGAFDYDYKHILEGSEWTSIEFIFKPVD